MVVSQQPIYSAGEEPTLSCNHPCRDETASWMGHPAPFDTSGWERFLLSQVSKARPFDFAQGRIWAPGDLGFL
jgi:hypothetical protein